MSGSSDGFGESEERERQVHEAILVGLQLLVSLDDFDELQAHQAHHRGRGRGDGRNDLAGYQFALDWTVISGGGGTHTSLLESSNHSND